MNKKTILHIDSDIKVLGAIKKILEKEGYEVISIANSADAVDILKDKDFDLTILDIMMPDMAGWHTFHQLSKTKPDSKVAFLTNLELSSQRRDALEKAGVKEYFTKPINIKDFANRINKLFKE
ncbi:MAG: response regulator [Candidatus Spechtbacterales bacterium]|nr:response regulator [Candidatus Spechtbacterales bacterium]